MNFLFLLISALVILTVMGLLFQLFYHRFYGVPPILAVDPPSASVIADTPASVADTEDSLATSSGIASLFASSSAMDESVEPSIASNDPEKSEPAVESGQEDEVLSGLPDNTEEKTETEAVQPPVPETEKESAIIPTTGSEDTATQPVTEDSVMDVASRPYLLMIKDVGEPYLDRFGLAPADFNRIKQAGFDIIEGNFDICARGSDVLSFLESAKDAGLKVIMPAGAGEAEWGYPCDDNYSADQKPEWQKDKVQSWVKKWAYHPAIYAWDISNEDGQNFPNAERYDDDWAAHDQAITLGQLQTAYKDVKAADPSRPVMVRMNGWYFYDYDSDFFRTGNAFGPGVADIVMVNAYSNVDEYYSDLVQTVATRAHNAVRAINPRAQMIVALGAWTEPPLWFKPNVAKLTNDASAAKKTGNLLAIAIFKYGAEGTEWYMPASAPELWDKLPEIFPSGQ